MKKLLTLLLVLVCSVGWCAGNTTETSGKSTIQTGPASFTNFVQLGELATPLKCATFLCYAPGVVGSYSSTVMGFSPTIYDSHAVMDISGGGESRLVLPKIPPDTSLTFGFLGGRYGLC